MANNETHNARAKTEFVSVNGQNYSRTFAICDCGWEGRFGASSDRMAHAHNAAEAAKEATK